MWLVDPDQRKLSDASIGCCENVTLSPFQLALLRNVRKRTNIGPAAHNPPASIARDRSIVGKIGNRKNVASAGLAFHDSGCLTSL
jgi:hypothetical protein